MMTPDQKQSLKETIDQFKADAELESDLLGIPMVGVLSLQENADLLALFKAMKGVVIEEWEKTLTAEQSERIWAITDAVLADNDLSPYYLWCHVCLLVTRE